MKILVTGSTGYIGEQLIEKLAGNGHSVKALYRSKEKIKRENQSNIQYLKGDLRNFDSLESAVQGCQAIIHLAAYAKVWAKDPQTYYEINVEGTQYLLRAAIKHGVKKFILTSTAGVFGPSVDGIINETSRRTLPYFSAYEETKTIAGEKALKEAGSQLEVITLYPTRVYGPGLLSESNGLTRLLRINLKGNIGIIPGNGKSIGNYAFIDDIVEGHILALKHGKGGEGYILGGDNISFQELFRKSTRIASKKTRLVHIPRLILLILAQYFETRTRIFKTAPMITRKWLKRYLYNWEVSSEKAKQELFYKITPIDVGLRKTIEWLKKEESAK